MRIQTRRQVSTTLIFSFLLLFSIYFFSTAVRAQEIPTIVPYVNDFANVIDSSYESMINDYAAQLESATTAEIAVLTVGSTQPMSIEEYAVEVFEKNGIGQRGKDNGILIVAAIEDRKWRIEVGYGLEGTINDAKAGRIGREYMTTYFSEEKYGEGLYLTVKTLGDIIAGDTELSAQFDEPKIDFRIIMLIILFAILVPIMIIIVVVVKTRKCPKCGGWMRVEYKQDKVCYVCKKCGYKKCVKRRRHVPFFVFVGGGSRGGGGGGSGGGGGFGGGGSGGGGASGGW